MAEHAIDNLVLGTLHMHLNKGTMNEIVEIIETNFDEAELRDAVVKLHEGLKEPVPGSR